MANQYHTVHPFISELLALVLVLIDQRDDTPSAKPYNSKQTHTPSKIKEPVI